LVNLVQPSQSLTPGSFAKVNWIKVTIEFICQVKVKGK
jgi:hypothetical protein